MRKIKIFSISILAVLLLVAVLPLSCVFADESVAAFDGTSVLTDLQDSTIAGKKFNIDNYPLDEDGTPELLAFTEFAFSPIHEYQQYYALYLYVYYPQGNLEDYEQNTVQMAIAYDSKGEPNAWHKFHIKLLSSDGNKVLYKFRIVDTEGQTIGSIFNRVGLTPSERRYDINSIELRPQGQLTADDYGIGGTWIYTGYSKGMHQSSMEESTLKSVAKRIDTLNLDVHQTYYRTWRNMYNTVANQLASVYFSVPNKIDKQYDELYAIDFDAYKYLSSPLFCIYESGQLLINEEKVYENLLNQRAMPSSEVVKLSNYTWLHWNRDYLSDVPVSMSHYASGNYNSKTDLDKLGFVFQAKKVNNKYVVYDEEIRTYMEDFSNKYGKDVRGKYNSLLFSDHYYSWELDYKEVESGVNIGRKIEATEEFKLIGSLSSHNTWQKLCLLFKGGNDDTTITFNPIQEVSYTDIKSLDEDAISEKYLVAKADVADFVDYVKTESAKNKTVYLFRFDVDSYYTSTLYAEGYGECGYVAQEPVYLDFDIISLTYEKDNVYTVIPVVNDPIDIIFDVESGNTTLGGIDFDGMFSDMLTKILTILFGIVAVICFVLLVVGMLKYLFKRR